MKQKLTTLLSIFLLLTFSAGCSAIGSKSMRMSTIYAAAVVLSFILLVGYCSLKVRKQFWFYLLFSSVFVVNTGYFLLSVSTTLDFALWSNRLAYLGSVFLPMSMMMIILNVIRIPYTKKLPITLLLVGILVFLVAASPGYLPVYYKEVSLETVNGVSVLNKTYGPWHKLYLFYLLAYTAAMIAAVTYTIAHKKIASAIHVAFLAVAVFGNVGVWLIEQLIRIDFEMLSISYIISELFLLGLHLLLAENAKLQQLIADQEQAALAASLQAAAAEPEIQQVLSADDQDIQTEVFLSGLPRLTPTEKLIFDFYIEGKTTKEIMASLQIKENTLKFHNKNLYSKLGVSSRKQLVAINTQIEKGSAK